MNFVSSLSRTHGLAVYGLWLGMLPLGLFAQTKAPTSSGLETPPQPAVTVPANPLPPVAVPEPPDLGASFLEDGKRMMAAKSFKSALEQFKLVVSNTSDRSVFLEAQKLYAEAHPLCLGSLRQQQSQMEADSRACYQEVTSANRMRYEAESQLRQFQAEYQRTHVRRIGDDKKEGQLKADIELAKSAEAVANTKIKEFQIRIRELQTQTSTVYAMPSLLQGTPPEGPDPVPLVTQAPSSMAPSSSSGLESPPEAGSASSASIPREEAMPSPRKMTPEEGLKAAQKVYEQATGQPALVRPAVSASMNGDQLQSSSPGGLSPEELRKKRQAQWGVPPGYVQPTAGEASRQNTEAGDASAKSEKSPTNHLDIRAVIGGMIDGKSTALMWVGLVIAGMGGLWLLGVAFRTSVLWGLASVIIPFAGLLFAIFHWDEAKWPVLLNVGGVILLYVGLFMGI